MNITVQLTGKPGLFLSDLSQKITHSSAPMLQNAGVITIQAIKDEVSRFAKNNTGKLENSFSYRVAGAGSKKASISVLSSSPYARIHETGGTITPKHAQALAIPVSSQARAAGSPRRFPGKLFRPRGKAILATTGGAGGGLTVHYVLRRSVTLSAKHYLTRAAKTAKVGIAALYKDMIVNAIRTSRKK